MYYVCSIHVSAKLPLARIHDVRAETQFLSNNTFLAKQLPSWQKKDQKANMKTSVDALTKNSTCT